MRVGAIDCGTNSIRLLVAEVLTSNDGRPALRDLTRDLTGGGGPFEREATWGRPQNLRAVQGRVEAGGAPAGGRTVELISNGRTVARTETDGGGFYGFPAAPRGEFEVRVQGGGALHAGPVVGVTELPVVQLP